MTSGAYTAGELLDRAQRAEHLALHCLDSGEYAEAAAWACSRGLICLPCTDSACQQDHDALSRGRGHWHPCPNRATHISHDETR